MQIVRDITTLSAPTAVVVTLEEARNYLKVDYGEDDDLITSLINTAQTRLEQYAGVAMSTRTLRVVAYVDNFIELPYVPTNTILEVEYWDGTAWVEIPVGGYQVLGETTKKIYLTSIYNNEFRFTYSCGYTVTPNTMKTALLKMVSDLYEYRESSVEATKPSANLMTAYELMKPFKRINVII
jgi:hypothetical protein